MSRNLSFRPKRRKRKIIIGENEKIVLLAIGAGIFFVGSLIFPSLPVALQPILKMRGQKGFLKLLRKMRRKGIINLGGEKITLTARGRKLQQLIQVEQIMIEQPKEWDGLWRLVSYDIPNRRNEFRTWFRRNLIRLGFKPIHESLWVFPYECKDEIAVIAQHLGVSPYVIVMTTDKLPNEDNWKDRFGLNDDEYE